MTTKPTITQEQIQRMSADPSFRGRLSDAEWAAVIQEAKRALELAAALEDETRKREEAEMRLPEKDIEIGSLRTRNAELERAVGELRDALLRSKKMIGPHSLHPDAEGFCIVEHALASTAHLVKEKEQK